MNDVPLDVSVTSDQSPVVIDGVVSDTEDETITQVAVRYVRQRVVLFVVLVLVAVGLAGLLYEISGNIIFPLWLLLALSVISVFWVRRVAQLRFMQQLGRELGFTYSSSAGLVDSRQM